MLSLPMPMIYNSFMLTEPNSRNIPPADALLSALQDFSEFTGFDLAPDTLERVEEYRQSGNEEVVWGTITTDLVDDLIKIIPL
jgi:hypothetical protein